MLKRHSEVLLTLIFILDMTVVVGVWLFSYYVRFYLPIIPVYKGIPPIEGYLKHLIFIIPLWAIVFKFSGLYIPRRGFPLYHEFEKIIKANTVGVIGLLAIVFFARIHPERLSRVVILYFWIFNNLFLILIRVIIRLILRALRAKGYNIRYVLVVGCGNTAKELIEKIHEDIWTGYKVVGILGAHKEDTSHIGNIPYLGEYNKIKDILKEYDIDIVFIALPFREQEKIEEILNLLADELVSIKIVPDIFHFDVVLNATFEDFDGLPILNISDSPLYGWRKVAKRIFDIVFSLLVIICCAPLFIIIAILIKLTSKGSIFYTQERMGMDGKVFKMLKFRTMPEDAEEKTGPVWAHPQDTRPTPIGKILRRTSLDELPQFFNVLKGDMSVVGPRPERPYFIEQFKKSVPKYMLRHKMKAGITGWAQVNGWRGNTSITKRIEYDLYYINNWSLLFDIKIIILTIFKGFINKNAY